MDFAYSDGQTSVSELARGILEKEVTAQRLTRLESEGSSFDSELWATLAEAGLLGIAVEEEFGGMGMGLLELCSLLAEAGRVLPAIPLLATLVLGALPIAAFATPEQKQRWLPAVVSGDAVLTAALGEPDAHGRLVPSVRASRDRRAWLLSGDAHSVPAATIAQRVLVPARYEQGVVIFLVDPNGDGVECRPAHTISGEEVGDLRFCELRLDDADLLGGDRAACDDETLAWIYQRALVGVCMQQIGVSERALEMTAAYVSEREQFGVPVGTFQAVQHRSADAYIDLQALRWVAWRAACRLAKGQTAAREVMVAKFWAAEAGARIAATAQHLHAGIGVDLDYPLHRYFLHSNALELCYGGAAVQLSGLGRDLARSGLEETS